MRAFTITVVGLLLVAVAINGLASWDARRHDRRVQALAAGLQPGQAVIVPREVDDRRLQRVRLQTIPRPAVVAFGSSRVMPLAGAALGLASGQFYNAGVSSASVEDHIAFWQLLKQGDRVPDIAIFSIDHWTLAQAPEEVRWLALADLVRAFLDGAGSASGWGGAPVQTLTYEWARFKELFSYTVLRASVSDLTRALRGRRRHGWEVQESLRRDVVAEDQVGDRLAVRADGSLIYESATERERPEQVLEEAMQFVQAGARRLEAFQVDRERLALLELLWRDMRAHRVELVVYLPPYHPAAWARIRAAPRAMSALAENTLAVAGLSERVGATFADTSDPESIPCGVEMFYDGHHARVGCLRVVVRRLLAAYRVLDAGRSVAAP